tara:strand:+ start:338 stop:535 length:198 start_codon:yes stop_codon:yes gene_type:complete
MKIIFILATGTLLTFPTNSGLNPDCFTQGHEIMKKIAIYQGPGPEQGWILNDSKVQVGGWYCLNK